MKKVYHLKTCDTCKRIIKTLPDKAFEFQDIKNESITEGQLEEMRALSGSYEALFSRRAKLYKEMGLKDAILKEEDYKNYILQHYTFLQRPVIVIEDSIFIGSGKKNLEALQRRLSTL